MRLDHLLSKEQLARPRVGRGAVASPPANAWWGVLKGGTSIIWRLPGPHAQVQVKLCFAVERGGGSGGCLTRCWVLKDRTTCIGSRYGGGCVCAGWFLLVVGPADHTVWSSSVVGVAGVGCGVPVVC